MRRLHELRRDLRGATAVEFAIVASLLILTILFILTVGLVLYLNQALDNATGKAARQIMTGVVQKGSISQAGFQAIVCGYLPAGFNCGDLVVNLYTVTEAGGPAGYYNFVNSSATALVIPALSPGAGSYSTGGPGSYEFLQVIYPITIIPSIFATALSGGVKYNGTSAYLAISTAAFRNEQYL